MKTSYPIFISTACIAGNADRRLEGFAFLYQLAMFPIQPTPMTMMLTRSRSSPDASNGLL
jgi:hypothetical protein